MPNEKTHADSIRMYLTGAASDGAAQADPDLSLGNYRSSSLVDVLGVSAASLPANITIDQVSAKNGTGSASLTFPTADTARYTAPSGSIGAAVTIANGETKIIEDAGDTSKFVRITRTSVVALTGTATLTLTDVFNNAIGSDNVSDAESTAGDDEIRAICLKNDSASQVTALKVYIGQLGTSGVSDDGQLGAAGSGTVETTGSFADWPDSGFCRIEESNNTHRETVYYTSRTATVLTVPAAGRSQLGTSAAAGNATDLIYAVPGIRIAIEAPTGDASTGNFTDKTGAGEGSIPALTWDSDITAATGLSIGTLATTEIYGLWIRRAVVAGSTAESSVLNKIHLTFEAA